MFATDFQTSDTGANDTGAEAVRRRVNKLLYGTDTSRRIHPKGSALVTKRERSLVELDGELDALWARVRGLEARLAA